MSWILIHIFNYTNTNDMIVVFDDEDSDNYIIIMNLHQN